MVWAPVDQKQIGRGKTRVKASNLVRWLESPKGHAWTDPFLFERDGRYWLFFEDYLYAQQRATLACAPLSIEGLLGEPRTILDTGSHASYPYVFCGGDDIYMIPETRALQTVRFYKAVEFPYKINGRRLRTCFPGRRSIPPYGNRMICGGFLPRFSSHGDAARFCIFIPLEPSPGSGSFIR